MKQMNVVEDSFLVEIAAGTNHTPIKTILCALKTGVGSIVCNLGRVGHDLGGFAAAIDVELGSQTVGGTASDTQSIIFKFDVNAAAKTNLLP